MGAAGKKYPLGPRVLSSLYSAFILLLMNKTYSHDILYFSSLIQSMQIATSSWAVGERYWLCVAGDEAKDA